MRWVGVGGLGRGRGAAVWDLWALWVGAKIVARKFGAGGGCFCAAQFVIRVLGLKVSKVCRVYRVAGL